MTKEKGRTSQREREREEGKAKIEKEVETTALRDKPFLQQPACRIHYMTHAHITIQMDNIATG